MSSLGVEGVTITEGTACLLLMRPIKVASDPRSGLVGLEPGLYSVPGLDESQSSMRMSGGGVNSGTRARRRCFRRSVLSRDLLVRRGVDGRVESGVGRLGRLDGGRNW